MMQVLAKLSSALMVLGLGLGWTAFRRGQTGEWSGPAVYAVYGIAAALWIASMVGLRARHRRADDLKPP